LGALGLVVVVTTSRGRKAFEISSLEGLDKFQVGDGMGLEAGAES
jgi:hypothetical protein